MSLRGRGLLIFVAVLCVVTAMIPSTVAASASSISYLQGTAFDNSGGGSTLAISLTQPVGSGDLLVGWFAQWGATGDVKVSDNVNGAWTRAQQSTQFGSSGDIAMYYVEGSEAASAGITITVSAASGADFQGAVADYSGVATVGAALSTMAVNRGSTSTISAGPTGSIASGDLVYAAEVAGVSLGAVPTPGSSDGSAFNERASTPQGSAFDEDTASSAAGAQTGTATLTMATDWYAVVAIFLPSSGSSSQPPTVPTGLTATSVTASSVDLSWNASTDSTGTLAGYSLYRNGTEVATTPAGTTTYDDTTASPSTSYFYTIDAYDTSGNHSAQSQPALSVTTPAATPPSTVKWVQGASVSTGSLVTSVMLQLTQPVSAGDLLVGWFGQYNSSGQVMVSDNVNGAWSRTGASTTFSSGGGDLAMFYVQDAAASSGLTITISAASATYLQGAVSEFSGIATTGALDEVAAARGNSTTVDSGPTSAVASDELVVGGIVTGGQPGTVTPGSTQGQTFTMGTETSSGTSDLEYVLNGATGTQDARATFSSATDWYSGVATFHPATSSGATPPSTVKWVQGASVSTGSLVTSVMLQLTQPVSAGDLLVGWFGQYNSSGQVMVSDNVNGAWSRTGASTTFSSGGGDLAMFYVQDAAASSGLTITISAASATYLQGAVSEFSGIATIGALDEVAAARGNSTTVDSGPTSAVASDELVVGGIVTGGQPGTVTPGSTQGQTFTMGTETSSGTSDLEYVLNGATGTQDARATFSSATDWYSGVATFHPATSSPPSVPTDLTETADTTGAVRLSWAASTDTTGTLAGYTVYRDGNEIGTAGPSVSTFTDSTVAASTTYLYTVDAFDTNDVHSAQSQPLSVTTPLPASPSAISKVLVIMDENESDDDLFPTTPGGTAQMPYLWTLAQEYGYATNWSDIGHPSLPNYLAIFAGNSEGLPDDCLPASGCEWSGPTVFSQAIAAGGTAKIYEESMATNCEATSAGYYDPNHNPWVYFDDATDVAECAADDVPAGAPASGALYTDIVNGTLPDIGFLKPNLQDDTTDGSFATADDWLRSWVSQIQAGPDWRSGKLAIAITFDESDDDAGNENVPFVLIAPSVNGVVVSSALNQYALTRLLDEVIGEPLLGNASTEPDIAPLFGMEPSG